MASRSSGSSTVSSLLHPSNIPVPMYPTPAGTRSPTKRCHSLQHQEELSNAGHRSAGMAASTRAGQSSPSTSFPSTSSTPFHQAARLVGSSFSSSTQDERSGKPMSFPLKRQLISSSTSCHNEFVSCSSRGSREKLFPISFMVEGIRIRPSRRHPLNTSCPKDSKPSGSSS